MTNQPTPTCEDADEGEHADGCLCGADPVSQHELTQDHQLPAATGGVVGDRAKRSRRSLAKAGEL
jgi:hypothetical protein